MLVILETLTLCSGIQLHELRGRVFHGGGHYCGGLCALVHATERKPRYLRAVADVTLPESDEQGLQRGSLRVLLSAGLPLSEV